MLFATLAFSLPLAAQTAPPNWNLPRWDLVSLALESHAIVLANAGYDADRHVVTTPLYGPLRGGDVVDLKPPTRVVNRTSGGGGPDDGEPVMLFLTRRASQDAPLDDTSGPWRTLPTGVRWVVSRNVCRAPFECRESLRHLMDLSSFSPGAWQGRDPFDVLGDVRGVANLTVDETITEIQNAIRRADAIRVALRDPTTEPARRTILDAMGPAGGFDDDLLVIAPKPENWENRVVHRAVEAFGAKGRFDDALTAVARLPWHGEHFAELPAAVFPFRWLLGAAASERPVAERLAALWLLRQRAVEIASVAEVVRCLTDADGRIRAAAADVAASGRREVFADLVLARIKVERDPRTKATLIAAAVLFGRRASDHVPVERTLVWGERFGYVARIGTTRVGEIPKVELHARREGLDVIATSSARSSMSSTRSRFATVEVPLLFSAPLGRGTYDIEAAVEVPNGPPVRIPLRQLTVSERSPALVFDSDVRPPPPVAPRAGCGCGIATGGLVAEGPTVGVALALMLARRRRRSSTRREPAGARWGS